MEITFVLLNRGMLAATSETDKPTFNLRLTYEQVQQIKTYLGNNYEILAIYPVLPEPPKNP